MHSETTVAKNAQPKQTVLSHNASRDVLEAPKMQSSEISDYSKAIGTSVLAVNPLPNAGKPSKPSPLLPWDTRWSVISDTVQPVVWSTLQRSIQTTKSLPSVSARKEFLAIDQKSAPVHVEPSSRLKAIVIDCEMVGTGNRGSVSELARLSAIDFFTGTLLIDSFVRPIGKVTDWRTKWSGITESAMRAAIASNEVLKNQMAARAELFKFMDSQTILIGHALHHDLEALGILHNVTVDSSKLAKAAVGKDVRKDWGLKTLCKELLGITIQDNGKNGHDSVEDALATREVVLWCAEHEEELKTWGSRKRVEHFAKQAAAKKKKDTKVAKPPRRVYYDYSDEDYYGSLSLAEFNEMCCYPSDYDNWSD